MRFFVMLLFIFAISVEAEAQYRPKKIRAKAEYFHPQTNFAFPTNLNNFERVDIYAFDKKKSNIGVTYKAKGAEKTTLTIYLYPDEGGTPDRLRTEYLSSLQDIANASNRQLEVDQYPVAFERDGFKLNGFKAEMDDPTGKSSLSVYECAKWLFKLRISSDVLDSAGISDLEKEMLELFDPIRLVKADPLTKVDLNVAPAAFADSLMLGSVLGSAFKKLEWAKDNIDSLERLAGFPGIYIEMHVESLKEFVKFQKEHPENVGVEATLDHLEELNSIIDSGFLEEFIYEQFNGVLIVPDGMEIDSDGFYQWKINNPVTIDLNALFYVIFYRE